MKKNKRTYVHPTSIIDPSADIGFNSKIWQFNHIMQNVTIGDNCTLGKYIEVSPNVTIGQDVKIQNNVSIYSGVIISDRVFIGPSVVFTNILNPRSFIENKNFVNTLVDYGASIGANSTILCGVTIGAYSLIGAGSVVTKNVKPYELVVGNPARVIGHVSFSGHRLIRPNYKFMDLSRI